MNTQSTPACAQCGELISPSWRICPVCETRLNAPTCPQCGRDVQNNWRRCPECEALLLCPQCGARMLPGRGSCQQCQERQPMDRQSLPLVKDPVCGIEFVLVRGGTYAMGDTLDQGSKNEQPVHKVTLDDFYLSRFPVTQAQWSILMKDNPSEYRHADHPVEQVTWSDAGEFARKLSQAAKMNAHFTLPAEAQWEYAARSGGRDDLYAGGDDIDAVAWFEDNSRGSTQPVGKKKPNGLGLYDMSGNVWEWCRDTYQADAYGCHDHHNPVIESSSPDRVIRGGSWNLDAWSARCARRFNFCADFHGPGLGFRLIMSN